MPPQQVKLDFSKAQPIGNAKLDFSKAQPLASVPTEAQAAANPPQPKIDTSVIKPVNIFGNAVQPSTPSPTLAPLPANAVPIEQQPGPGEEVARDLRSGQIAKGIHTAAVSEGKAFAPLMLPAAVTAPVPLAMSLAAGYGGQKLAQKGATALGATPDQVNVAGDVGAIAGGLAGGGIGNVAREGIRNWAMEDPDTAALKGLQVNPKSRIATRNLEAVRTARPFLKGVSSEAELQQKLPEAKNEVWQPYRDALERVGNRPVLGPDGPTTVGALEEERLQLSALNRGLKTGNPEAIQLAQQKGMTQAQLLDREAAVKAHLDPALRDAGIDPKLIRKVHGSLSQIQNRVTGRESGMVEAPMGFGKFLKGARAGGGVGRGGEIESHGGFITEPIVNIGAGIRDLAAGRGAWSGSPVDIGIREGFRTGGPKPVFTLPARGVAELLPAAGEGTGPTALFSTERGPVGTGGPTQQPRPFEQPGAMPVQMRGAEPENSQAIVKRPGTAPTNILKSGRETAPIEARPSNATGTAPSAPPWPRTSEPVKISQFTEKEIAQTAIGTQARKILNDPAASARDKMIARETLDHLKRMRSEGIPGEISYRMDRGIRWASRPGTKAEVAIPKNLSGEEADKYAKEKLDLQDQFMRGRGK